jgi:hypothetical protein
MIVACVYMTDSATQSASPLAKDYHGSEKIPIGRRFDPKRRILLGLHELRKSFVRRGNTFPAQSECERRSPLPKKIRPHLMRPATAISRLV